MLASSGVDLTGKIALVTGAGRGLGRHFALALGEAGAAVAAVGRTRSALEETVAMIHAKRGAARAFQGDLTQDGTAASVVAAVNAELGDIDILVNNAGSMRLGKVATINPAVWWSDFELNVKAPMLLTQAVLPTMISRQSGVIVNITSAAADWIVPAASSYIASKAAVDRFTAVLNAELTGTGVLAFLLGPRAATDMTEALTTAEAFTAEQRAMFTKAQATEPELKLTRSLSLLLRILSGELDHLAGQHLESETPPE